MYSLPEEPDHHDPDTEGWIDDHALASLLAADERPGQRRALCDGPERGARPHLGEHAVEPAGAHRDRGRAAFEGVLRLEVAPAGVG